MGRSPRSLNTCNNSQRELVLEITFRTPHQIRQCLSKPSSSTSRKGEGGGFGSGRGVAFATIPWKRQWDGPDRGLAPNRSEKKRGGALPRRPAKKGTHNLEVLVNREGLAGFWLSGMPPLRCGMALPGCLTPEQQQRGTRPNNTPPQQAAQPVHSGLGHYYFFLQCTTHFLGLVSYTAWPENEQENNHAPDISGSRWWILPMAFIPRYTGVIAYL
jgi:hypothetical protein